MNPTQKNKGRQDFILPILTIIIVSTCKRRMLLVVTPITAAMFPGSCPTHRGPLAVPQRPLFCLSSGARPLSDTLWIEDPLGCCRANGSCQKHVGTRLGLMHSLPVGSCQGRSGVVPKWWVVTTHHWSHQLEETRCGREINGRVIFVWWFKCS